MHIKSDSSNGSATITLSGRFDFNVNKEFRTAYESFLGKNNVKTIELDFSGVEFIDSSALGMLLVLREKATETGQALKLANCRGTIRQVLDVAHFERFFNIS